METDTSSSTNGRFHHNKRFGSSKGDGPQPRSNKVCYHWQAGRCTRHPCLFLHAEPDDSSLPSSKRPHHPNPNPNPNPNASSALVWRNPNASSSINPSRWGPKSRLGGAPRAPAGAVCKYFLAGTCSYADKCRYLHSYSSGDAVSLLAPLQGHTKVVTGIALPSGSDKLYSGSKDESVRVWDCQTGKCVGAISMGGEVGCLISEGPWVFVGVPNAVKAWNTQMSTEMSLTGPAGQVYALVVGHEMLFAGIQDGRILAWKFSAVGNCFEPAASLIGHRLAVVSMVVGATRLYSGSMDHTIRVWDLTTLQCIQTLTDHTSVVMSVLCWDQFLLSCSLDNTIKVWVATESGNLEVTYTHSEDHGVLVLCGMHDAQAKPVLFCSCNDNIVRLYDLPSFSERGKIFAKEEVRAIQSGPGGLFFTGDGTGELKVWNWATKDAPAA
ncbi:zinc finger CCCH domain-containing protein 17-like [Iris pallida]|uniref:Zinc finger CCCH domain-containing protein 17-like n=1 Tax=Iris pallida TaxID=29817 RepID=A0AAX6HBG3_IRIPA|nr:zinc finger CCCH domain-containing protein 17-like [Iris pallida]